MQDANSSSLYSHLESRKRPRDLINFHCGICSKQLSCDTTLLTNCGHFFCLPSAHSKCTNLRVGASAGRCEQCHRSCVTNRLLHRGQNLPQDAQERIFFDIFHHLETVKKAVELQVDKPLILGKNIVQRSRNLKNVQLLRRKNQDLRSKVERKKNQYAEEIRKLKYKLDQLQFQNDEYIRLINELQNTNQNSNASSTVKRSIHNASINHRIKHPSLNRRFDELDNHRTEMLITPRETPQAESIIQRPDWRSLRNGYTRHMISQKNKKSKISSTMDHHMGNKLNLDIRNNNVARQHFARRQDHNESDMSITLGGTPRNNNPVAGSIQRRNFDGQVTTPMKNQYLSHSRSRNITGVMNQLQTPIMRRRHTESLVDRFRRRSSQINPAKINNRTLGTHNKSYSVSRTTAYPKLQSTRTTHHNQESTRRKSTVPSDLTRRTSQRAFQFNPLAPYRKRR